MSVNPGSLAVPLGTDPAASKQYKAQEACLTSLGTGSSLFICLGQKPSRIQNKALQGHHSTSRPKKATAQQQKRN